MKTYTSEERMLKEIDRCLDKSNEALKSYEENLKSSQALFKEGDVTLANQFKLMAKKEKERSDRYLQKSKRIGLALAKFRTEILPGVDIQKEVRV